MKNTYVNSLLLWMYTRKKAIAIFLILIMILSVALGVGLSHQSEVMRTAKAQMAYESQMALLESEQARTEDIENHLNTFLSSIEQENYTAALEAINYVIEEDTSVSDYYLKHAGTYVLMENYDLAMKDFYQCLDMNPKQPDVYALIGQIYMEKEDYAKAIEAFGHAIDLSENQPEVYYNKAICHMLTGTYDEAAACLRKVIQSDCDDTLKADAQTALDTLINEGIVH